MGTARIPRPLNAILCECAFCTFPDKSAASREFARVLRDGGRIRLSDLTRCAALSRELAKSCKTQMRPTQNTPLSLPNRGFAMGSSLLAWISWIADAQPVERRLEYVRYVDLDVRRVENHDEPPTEMVQRITMKLLSTESSSV